MFILQYHVCKNKNKKELNLHTKGKKKNIGHFGRVLLVIYTMVCFRPLSSTLCKTKLWNTGDFIRQGDA